MHPKIIYIYIYIYLWKRQKTFKVKNKLTCFVKVCSSMPQAPQHSKLPRHRPLWQLLCPPVNIFSHFPWLWHVQDGTSTEGFHDGWQTLSHPGLSIPLFTFCSEQWVKEKKVISTRQMAVTLPRYSSGQMMVPFTIGSKYSSITLGSGI